MTVKIYHNPRCSKSRQTLQLLHDNAVEANVIEYLDTPPNNEELASLLNMLGLTARQLMRSHETEYKASGADNTDLNEAELIDIMVKNPKLIERPIVVNDGKAAIGRPPELIMEII